MSGAYSVREGRGYEGHERKKQESFHKQPWRYVKKLECYPKNNDGVYTEEQYNRFNILEGHSSFNMLKGLEQRKLEVEKPVKMLLQMMETAGLKVRKKFQREIPFKRENSEEVIFRDSKKFPELMSH